MKRTLRASRLLGPRAVVAIVVVALTLPAFAQRLPSHLPADTVLALGTYDLAAHADLLDGVIRDWERFGVGPALQRAFGDVDPGMLGVPLDGADMDSIALPAALEGLELLDLIGTEAWLAVSVSPFNPLPTVTLLALVDDAVGARFDAVIAEAATESGAQSLREGDATFVAVLMDGLPVAATRFGELLAVSSNPEALRGVLRAAQGGGDPSFADSAGYVATLGTMAPGQLYGYLDLEPLARTLTPMASGLGFDRSVARVAAVLETFGTSAGVARVTSRGSESESVQLLRSDGRDPALYALLAGDVGGVPRRLLDAIPAEAVSVSATAGDPGAVFDYLMTLLRELPELALGDPEGLLRDMVGVDLRRDVFSWMGDGSLTITTGFGPSVDPGVPADDLLGETAIVFLSNDDAAARAGLERTGTMLASMVSAFADPMGAGGMVQPEARDVAGVTVTSFAVFPGLDLHVAAANGFALVATSAGAADAVARAIAGDGELPETIARLLPEVPTEASSFTISDDRATLRATADQMAMQLQVMAGLSGGAGLDFDAIEGATEALEGFMLAVAERLGGTVTYGVGDGAALRGVSRSEVDWR